MTIVGLNVFFIIFLGQIMFHVLTCVERYLAVVHPITYRGLKRSGPGEVGKDRERVDQSKQRAFYTIMSIMGVLWLLFVGVLVCVWLGFTATPLMSYRVRCVEMISAIWFNLPNSLLLPLLFLHRVGKFTFCCSTAKKFKG
ncbi:hypothetical protein Q5P01_002949 [Channa striata]|uniref:Uncharacterized protein n=1 Tax=Channa striata TaxID=64152 RepID=A0AA88T489_CHASR|nr:hypothetical protein Q5P01_002949 [Channa striata]